MGIRPEAIRCFKKTTLPCNRPGPNRRLHDLASALPHTPTLVPALTVHASYTVLMILVGVLLYLGFGRFENGPSWEKIWNYGIGTVTGETLLSRGTLLPLPLVALLSNIPQVCLSVIYFWYNNILTSIAMATEWDRFGSLRKGLRVSKLPRGAQRGSHMLQLPYRVAVPLMATLEAAALDGIPEFVSS